MNNEFMPKVKSIRTRHRLAKVKRYFTEKPKGNIWKRATIYLILLKYLGPMAVLFSLFMMVGLAAPDADITDAAVKSSQAIADVFEFTLTKMFEIGQGIAQNNPIISKVLLFAFANIVWIFYVGMFYLILDIIRHITSWAYQRRLSKLARPEVKK